MRADALERRKKLLAQARHVFARQGRTVALDVIADAAGVGIATLYRNFASREELLQAVMVELVAEVDQAISAAATGPYTAESWRTFITHLSELHLGAFTDILEADLSEELIQAHGAAHAKLKELLTTYALVGVIRGEITAESLMTAVGIITRPQSPAVEAAAPDVTEQLVEAYITWSLNQ